MEQARQNIPADNIVAYVPELAAARIEDGSIYEVASQAVLRMVASERHAARQEWLREHAKESYDAVLWAQKWAADPAVRQGIEQRNMADLAFARNQVSIANSVANHIESAEHAIRDERDAVQHSLGSRVWQHILFPGKSKLAPDDQSLLNRVRGAGLAVVSPTGSGKTHVQGKVLDALGIGLPRADDPSQNRRALVCVTDQSMVNQYLGVIGEDTFRKALNRPVSLGAYWQYGKDKDKDITLVVTSTLPKLLEDGVIKPEEYDVTVVDEGHRILGKRALETFSQLSGRLMLFTATPTYDERRQLQKTVDVVSEGDIRSFIERDILSPVRLFTYRPNEGLELETAAYLASKVIAMGRKVLVYCKSTSSEKGQVQEKDTEYVSRRINELTEVGKKQTASKVVGVIDKHQSKRSIKAFQDGVIRSLVTVNMLREGYNDPDVDTVIIVGPCVSMVDVEQKLGRCMRKSDNEAWAMEVIPRRKLGDHRQYYSLWNVMGLEAIHQGKLMEKAAPRPTLDGWTAVMQSPDNAEIPSDTPQPVIEVNTVQDKDHANILAQVALPAQLGTFYENTLLRRVVLSPDANAQEELKERSKSLEAMAKEYGLPESWLVFRFDKAELPYTTIYQFDPETGQRSYSRWYDTAVLEKHFQDSPLPVGGQRISITSMQEILGATKNTLLALLKEFSIEGQPGIGVGKRAVTTYSMDIVALLEAEIKRVPAADEASDMAIIELQKEFRANGWPFTFPASYIADTNNKIESYERRLVGATGIGRIMEHISLEDAERIREEFRNNSIATNRHISVTEVAKLAGVVLGCVLRNLTDEDKEGSAQLRQSPTTRAGLYLRRQKGLAVVERLEPKKVPPELVPLPMVISRTEVKRGTLEAYVFRNRAELDPVSLNVGFQTSLVTCFGWWALQRFEKQYGVRADLEPVDYERIQRGDTAYMREVQALHIDDVFLQPLAGWMDIGAALEALNCTGTALRALIVLVKEKSKIEDVLADQGGAWRVKKDIIERISRYPIKEARPDLVSHTRLSGGLKLKGLAWPHKPYFQTGDRMVARGLHNKIDVYYTKNAVKNVMVRAEAEKSSSRR